MFQTLYFFCILALYEVGIWIIVYRSFRGGARGRHRWKCASTERTIFELYELCYEK